MTGQEELRRASARLRHDIPVSVAGVIIDDGRALLVSGST